MDCSNYRTINKTSNPEQYNWCLSPKPEKNFTRVGLKLSNGKMYDYACRFPIQEDDVAIVGKDVIYSSCQIISKVKTTGQFGKVIAVSKPFTGQKSHFAELDFVFTKEVSKKTISACIDYLLLQGDGESLQYGQRVEPVYPITFLIRKLLAASSVIAFADFADRNAIEKAIECIHSEQVISDTMLDTDYALSYAEIDLEDIYVDDKGKSNNLEYGFLNIVREGREIDPEKYPVIKEFVNKYCFIGAVSIMVRGGFKNLLEAFLYAKPPIAAFYDEMLELVCERGNADCIELLKEYSEDKAEQYSVAERVMVAEQKLERLNKSEEDKSLGVKPLSVADYKKLYTLRNLGDDKYAVNKYKGNDSFVVIPEKIGKNSVAEIGDHAFSGCTGLTHIEIPNSVTKIDDYAFRGCTGLTHIEIPNSVTKIGEDAFSGCTGLTEITIPNSVTEIGDGAFYDCTGLTHIEIPNSVTEICQGAFDGCTGLTEITIPNSVTEIGWRAFECCTGLTHIEIPNSVTEIGYYAFEGCNATLKVEENSYAHKYAQENDLKYEIV